jgi:ABC-2 type transport system permease protein
LTMQNIAGDPANADEVEMIRIMLRGENAALVALDTLARFGGPIALVFGAMIVGSEYGWNTVKTVLTQRGPRRDLLFGSVAALLAVLAVIAVVSVAVASLASFIVAVVGHTDTDLPDLGTLFPALGAAWLSLSAWTLFGAVLASILKSAAGAVAVGLVYALALENAVGLLSERFKVAAYLAQGMIGRNASVLPQALAPEGLDIPAAAIDPLQATLVLTGAIVASVTVMFLLQRRDYA